MQEVKFCYQNISVTITANGFHVWNKSLFTSTDAYDCVALLHRDGKLVLEQQLEGVSVAAESHADFPLPFPIPVIPGEYALTISFRLKEDTIWAKKGHEVAFGQGVIAVVRSIPSKKVTPFTVTHGTHNIGVRGENFDVLFSDLNGGLDFLPLCRQRDDSGDPPAQLLARSHRQRLRQQHGRRSRSVEAGKPVRYRQGHRQGDSVCSFMAAPSSRTPPARWKPTAWS